MLNKVYDVHDEDERFILGGHSPPFIEKPTPVFVVLDWKVRNEHFVNFVSPNHIGFDDIGACV